MNTPWQVIAELEADNSKLVKQGIVRREALAQNDDFFNGCNLAFDALVTFGIAKIPESKYNGPGLDFKEFSTKTLALIHRQSTGHDARDLVKSMMDQATKEQWNGWYRRILLKDLRCGMSESTINKVCFGDWIKKVWVAGIAPQYRIQVFESQLAKDSADHPGHMTGKKLVDCKSDGNRFLTFVWPSEKRIQHFSRNGKEINNFPNITEQLLTVVEDYSEPYVLDGEIMSSSFQDLMKQIHRKSNVQTTDASLHLFDWVPMKDFLNGVCPIQQYTRSKSLQIWHNKNAHLIPNVKLLDHEIVDLDTQAGLDRLEELKRLAAELGAEGVMVKDIHAGYECSRNFNWLKIKPIITLDLEVVGVELGEEGKKYEKVLGNLICEGYEQGKFIRVSVGSGFDENQRAEFWKNRCDLVGQIVEIEADAVTKSQDGEFYSLRFPRFKRFRGFVPGEKI